MIKNLSIFRETLATGSIKQAPEDFRVAEVLRFEPEGTGDHLYLYIEKTNANTEWVQRQLAKIAGLQARDIGYAGLKDRYAVTRQWFSVYAPNDKELDFSSLPDELRIVRQTRGQKKLKQAAVLANQFFIRTKLGDFDTNALTKQLTYIRDNGFPNYFGSQRFGLDGRNIDNLIALGKGKRFKPHQKGMFISAGRAYIFNQILNERVKHDCWNQWIAGDVAMLDGTRSIFPIETVTEELEQRLASFDIHPALPLYGTGEWPSTLEQQKLEQKVYAENPSVITALEKLKVEVMPRASRVVPQDMQWQLHDVFLDLHFTLPAGAFATTLIEQIITLSEFDVSD